MQTQSPFNYLEIPAKEMEVCCKNILSLSLIEKEKGAFS